MRLLQRVYFAKCYQRINAIIAIATMVFLIFSPNFSYSATLNDLTRKQNEASKRADELQRLAGQKYGIMSNVKDAVKQLTNQIIILQTRIRITRNKIYNTERQIHSTSVQIAKKEAELAVYLKKQAEALQALYIFGQSSSIETLFASNSLSEVMARDQYVTALEQKIEIMMADIKRLKAELEEKKNRLEERRRDLKNFNKELSVQRNGLQIQRATKRRFLANAEAEYERLKAQAAEQQRIENQIERLIAAKLLALRRSKRIGRGTGIKVSQGDVIGYEGSTGYSTGPHLHWEVIVVSSGNKVNPRGYVPDPFIWPMTSFVVTQEFGWTDYARAGAYGGKPHMGIDISAAYGTPIHAAGSGEIILDEWYRGYGNCVIIDHNNGYWTLYGHMTGG